MTFHIFLFHNNFSHKVHSLLHFIPQAIWSIVKKKNRAQDYSNVEDYPKFGSFVRAVIGLPYVPLDRMEEAMDILKKKMKATTGPRKKFAKELIAYLQRTWLEGSIPLEVWNMFDHRGVSTNNHAESYNAKLGAKKKLSKHPNPYTLVEEIKTQLRESSDTVISETGNTKKKCVNKNSAILRDARKALMKDLSKRNIDLDKYMVQIGAKTLKYEARVMNDPDPDPLGFGEREIIENESDCNEGLSLSDSCSSASCSPVTCPPTAPARARPTAPPTVPPTALPTQPRKGPHRRKKQAPVANSEDSFVHVEAQPQTEEVLVNSVGGEELRNIRRRQEEESESNSFSASLSVAAVASAGFAVLSRFTSRSSARRSSVGKRPTRLSVGASPRPPPCRPSSRQGSRSPSPSPSESFPSLPVRFSLSSEPSCSDSDPISMGRACVKSLGFRFSSSQPVTKGDGNCMVSALFDQLRKCSHPILQSISNVHELRLYVCSKLYSQLDDNLIFWVSDISPKIWVQNMTKNGVWADDVFLQLASNIFNKNIILIPLSPSSAHHGGMYSDIRSVDGGSGDPFLMLYFEEWRTAGHYQSLEIDPNVDMNRVLAHFNWKTKCLSRTHSTSRFSESSSAPAPPPPPAPRSCPPPPPPPQLTSTRQRLESDTGITFSESPIGRHGGAPVTIPGEIKIGMSRGVAVSCH